MKRLLAFVGVLVLAAIAVPPLYFAVFPAEAPPELPPPGRRLMLPGGVGVNVLDTGRGPAVVMVHGLPGSAYEWRETIREVAARGRRAIAYDRVGYGHSDARREGRHTPAANADELLAVLEELNLRDATVAGWSYGGVTGMIAAQKDPSRIGRLVLVGTGGPDSPDAKPPEPSAAMRAFYSDPVLRWRVMVPPLGVNLMKVLSAMAFSDQPQPDWWLEGLRANFARWDTLVTYREEMFGLDPDADPGAFDPSQISVPTLLLHGDDDRLAPVAIARYLASVIPNAELVEYPGGSHMLPVTHADALAERITGFGDGARR